MRTYGYQFGTIFSDKSISVVDVRIHEPVAQQDANCSAKLEEVLQIIQVKQELVVRVACVHRNLFVCHHRRSLHGRREVALYTFGESFDYL